VQGQGVGTPRKQARLFKLLTCSLRASKAPAVREYPFWYLDGNAGCGVNHEVGCNGSPRTFMDAAEKMRRRFDAMFCDRDEKLFPELVHNLKVRCSAGTWPDGYRCACRCADNSDALREFARWIAAAGENPRFAQGAVFFDANGFPGGYPLELLPEFLAKFPRLDLILNVNLAVFRMVRGALESANPRVPNRDKFVQWRIREFAGLPKYLAAGRHWYVFLPSKRDGMHFVLFYAYSGGQRDLPKGLLPLGHPAVERLFARLSPGDPEQNYFWPDLWTGENHAE
jgi:hypothetical protein